MSDVRKGGQHVKIGEIWRNNSNMMICTALSLVHFISDWLARLKPFHPVGSLSGGRVGGVGHRSLRKFLHPSLFCDCLSNCYQLHPASLISPSIDCLQLFLGSHLFRFPCGFHLKAWLVMVLAYCLWLINSAVYYYTCTYTKDDTELSICFQFPEYCLTNGHPMTIT